jgi:hypothetical protein
MVSGQLYVTSVRPGYRPRYPQESFWALGRRDKYCPCRESNPGRPLTLESKPASISPHFDSGIKQIPASLDSVQHRKLSDAPSENYISRGNVAKTIVRSEACTAVTVKNVVLWDIKNAVRTSEETHYVSATELSPLMLCKVWGFHGGDYEECRLLRYKNPSSYRTGDTLRLRYRAESVNAMQYLRFSRRWLWRIPSSGIWMCRSCDNRRFGGMYRLHHQGDTRIGDLGTTLAVINNRSTLATS